MMTFARPRYRMCLRSASAALLLGMLFSSPLAAFAQPAAADLPNAPVPQTAGVPPSIGPSAPPTLLGTPKRILQDEVHIVTSPAHIHAKDMVWILPVAVATAASLATDSFVMRHVVSRDPGFNSSAANASDVLRGVFIGGPVALWAAGKITSNTQATETGLLAGEAMVDGFITSEGIKYIALRERPDLHNARGHFWQGDAASDPSFVSGHSIVAWSSAAVLASEYTQPWEQVGIYTLATGVSLTRVLGQQHFPTDVLLGSVAGWLIGRYVFRTHYFHVTG